MKYQLSILLAFSLVSASVSAPVTATSKIDSVRLFPQSAEIVRYTQSEIPEGASTLKLSGLPNRLNTDTLRFEVVESSRPVMLRDVKGYLKESDLEDHPELKALKKEAEPHRKEQQRLELKISQLRQKIDFAHQILESFADNYGEDSAQIPTEESIENTWNYYDRVKEGAQSEIQSLEQTLETVNETLQDFKDRYQTLKDQLSNQRQVLEIQLESEQSQTVKLRVTYQLDGSSWNPIYEVRADPESGALQWVYAASISQYTGVDWEDVTVSLATARPNRSGNVPELSPIRLNQIKPELMRSKQSMRMDAAMELGAPAPAASFSAPVFQSSFTSFQVTLPQRISLKSGSENQKVVIQEKSIDASFWTEVVPTRRLTGYLMAEVDNPFEMPVLSGQATLFVDGVLVGKSHLEETPISEPIRLSLGVDERVEAEREKGKLDEGNQGFFEKSTQLTRQYFTKVTNLRDQSHRIVVKDQFPISENEKIEVKRISPKANEAKFEENTGLFEWDLNMAAGETRKLETRFEVTFPEDWQIPQHF